MSLILKRTSDNYGDYYLECIGVIDFNRMINEWNFDEWYTWTQRFHPKKHCPSHTMLRLSEINTDDPGLRSTGRFALFVPTDRVNAEWDHKAWKAKHGITSRSKTLPISLSEKEIKSWQQSAPEYLLPDYFVTARSITDLQADLPNYAIAKDLRLIAQDIQCDPIWNPIR